MTLEGRLRDPDYRNWVKSALCLQYTRDGLVSFTRLTSLELNQNIIQQLRLNRNQSVYNLCPTIAFDTRRKSITCCGNCNDILREVMKYRPGRLDLNLRNSDPTQLLHQHWQCAKLYMNPGQDVHSTGPEDTNMSGLLNFIDRCTVPRGYVNNPDRIRQVRETRNRVLQTSSMTIKEDDFQNVITPLLLDLLEDPGFLLNDPDAKIAVEKIKEVKKADFIIPQDNEKKGLDALTNDLRDDVKKNDNAVLESKIPAEILQMDERAIELYKNALEEGKEHNYSIRLMVTGPYGVGKSTLTKRLLCQDVDINDRTSTDGIDVHVKKCKVSLETSRWKMNDTDDTTTQRLAKVLQNVRAKDTADESLSTENASEDYDGVHLQDTDKETDGNELYTLIYVRDDNAPKSAETSTSSKTAAEAYENITSDTGNIVDVDDVPKSSDYNRLKHKELLLKDLKDVSSVTNEDEDHADVSIWDFGGQSVFYTNHQMFLSRRAVYILVIDMSLGIHAVVEDDEPYFDCSGSKSLKIEDFLDIWLNSIHGLSDGEKSGTPKVILVGTHADKLNPDTRYKQTEAIFDAIRYRFSDKDVRFHFIEKDFGLSNAEIDPKLDDLRKTIFDVARKQSYWGEMRPAKWIPLERLLEELRRKGVEVMSRSEVADLNRNLPVPIADDQLELFLCFQHETANIMYFSVPELLNYIVLSPKFLVNALKSLITAYMFCKKQVAILDKWIEFRQKGILRISLIDAVWNREENQIFKENREHILSLMEHLNIIARPVLYSDDDEPENHNRDYYLVPCMLKESPPDSVFHAEGPPISKTCLRLVLENVAFPSAIFNRLLVGCMSYWPLARSGEKYHIYCGCGQFDVDVQHRLTLVFHSKVVSLRIMRYSQINRYPGVDICRRVYRTVKEILERIGKCLSLVLTYKILIQCPQCTDSVTSMKCWHSIEKLKSCDEFPCHEHEHDPVAIRQPCDLLKYWFEQKDRDHENNSDDTVWPSVLDPAIASRVPTDKELGKISKEIGKELQLLFLELGISNARIWQIRDSNPFSVAAQVVQLLLEWRKQRGCLATFKELETAMNSVGTDTELAFKDIH